MRETGPNLGGLSYQHIQRPRVFGDEAWIDHLVRGGSLRHRALKKSRRVEECLKNTAATPLHTQHRLYMVGKLKCTKILVGVWSIGPNTGVLNLWVG